LLIINPTKLEVVFLYLLGKRPDKKSLKFLTRKYSIYIPYINYVTCSVSDVGFVSVMVWDFLFLLFMHCVCSFGFVPF
jgi:hypothetical protein